MGSAYPRPLSPWFGYPTTLGPQHALRKLILIILFLMEFTSTVLVVQMHVVHLPSIIIHTSNTSKIRNKSITYDKYPRYSPRWNKTV